MKEDRIRLMVQIVLFTIILVIVLVFSLGIINVKLPVLANTASYHSDSDTHNYYIFPDGLKPVVHTYQYNFWLCEDKNGEYLQCVPQIKKRPKDNNHDG